MPYTLGGFSDHVNHPRRVLRSHKTVVKCLVHQRSLLVRQSLTIFDTPHASETVAEYQHNSAQVKQVDLVYRRLQRYMSSSAKLYELSLERQAPVPVTKLVLEEADRTQQFDRIVAAPKRAHRCCFQDGNAGYSFLDEVVVADNKHCVFLLCCQFMSSHFQMGNTTVSGSFVGVVVEK
jgi:hypothetical protein